MPAITFAESVSSSLSQAASDAEFLRQIPWTEDADSILTEAARDGDLKTVWAALTQQVFGLGARANRNKVHERRAAVGMALWTLPEPAPLAEVWKELAKRMEAARESALAHRAKKKHKSSEEQVNGEILPAEIKIPRKQLSALSDWLDSPRSQSPSAGELLVLAELLRMLGRSLPAKLGISLWRCVLLAAANWSIPTERDALLAGELPWVLGLLFSHVKGSESLRNQGRQTLCAQLEEDTDTDGTLRAEEMERLFHWLTPLVRAAEWGYAADEPWWDEAGQERFQLLINRVAGCLAGDGHFAFDPSKSPHALPMLLTAARLAGGSKKAWPLKFLWEVAQSQPELSALSSRKHSAKLKPTRRRAVETEADAIVQQSDWGRVACLRNHAGRDADVFAITHHQSLPRIDFSPFGHALIQGLWELEVSLDNQPIALPEEWTCVCWHTDSDGDYLELQQTLNENRRIERQVFLSRTDHFLVMADCISGVAEAVINYTARWPLVEGAKVSRNDMTRERVVSLGGLSMRTFPLALPAEIVQSTAGSWGLSEKTPSPCLELRQTGVGGLYAPVVFDWTPARQNSDADWRTLTVTENGPKVKSDRASGHRLRLGNQQLLLYRSLVVNGELRTVLGHHTGHETVFARFDKNGDVKPLLIVE